MRFLPLSLAVMASAASIVLAEEELKIDVTYPVECERKTQEGDKIFVHYTGRLADTGKVFDSSHNRNAPFSFVMGRGMVIKGWDQGLLDMCIGEKRTLTVPPELGYGQRGMAVIPGGSTLIFDTELMSINGVEQPTSIVAKSVSSDASSVASSVADEATGGVKEAVQSKAAEAVEALKVTLADTDGDGQEHNEL